MPDCWHIEAVFWRHDARFAARCGTTLDQMTPPDRLLGIASRPAFVERAARMALRDAAAWRIGGGAAPARDAFVTAAVAIARLELDRIGADTIERSRTIAGVRQAAHCFATSALYRRLMTIPASSLLRLPHAVRGADVVVRDRQRRLHAVALTVSRDAFDAGRLATQIVRSTPFASADRLAPITIHIFSLVAGKRHAFARDLLARSDILSNADVA